MKARAASRGCCGVPHCLWVRTHSERAARRTRIRIPFSGDASPQPESEPELERTRYDFKIMKLFKMKRGVSKNRQLQSAWVGAAAAAGGATLCSNLTTLVVACNTATATAAAAGDSAEAQKHLADNLASKAVCTAKSPEIAAKRTCCMQREHPVEPSCATLCPLCVRNIYIYSCSLYEIQPICKFL